MIGYGILYFFQRRTLLFSIEKQEVAKMRECCGYPFANIKKQKKRKGDLL
jgi:hypothetical protein